MKLLTYASIALVACFFFFYTYKKTAPTNTDSNTVVYVGTNAEYQPFSFLDNNDQIVGLDIDIAQEVCKRLGKQCVLLNMSFDALIPEIQLGTIHMIAAGMSPTPERAKRVFFTNPHLQGNPLVVVASTSLIEQLKNDFNQALLRNYRIAVNQGYVSDDFVTHTQYPQVIRLSGNGVSEGLLALQSGQADVYIVAQDAIKPYFDQDSSKKYCMIPLAGTQESTALAVSKQYPDLYQQIQKILDGMQQDGTINHLIKKWNIA